jgi:DNA-binding response OmpR family regulator
MKKILIIEDEEVLSSILKEKLIIEGFDVFVAKDGEEGLSLMREIRPDLILLDILMPRKDGFEVLEAMKKDPDLSGMLVIIISNSGQPVEIERALKLGAKDYLVKAEFDPKEVVDKVHKYLGWGASKEEPSSPKEKSTVKSVAGNKDAAGYKVLVVEDDKFLRELIGQKLTKEKFQVIEAIDGEEGLKKLELEKPDIVLLDLIMPGIDGFEVLRRVKQTPDLSDIPVVILSNLGQRDDVEKGIKLGAKDFLIKAHFTPKEIIEKIKKILGGKQASA